ncbi:MAG: TraR/DksA C4-type zinc finger protein [Clostridiales bacterium]|jgi:YteA family regulatory protein|nr:TraR/DksA C4-type zinc finger protein [Clostridiales bacterium]
MDTTLIRHKLQLQELKKDLIGQTEMTEGLQEHEGLRDSTQELTVIDNHPADVASENYERAKDISLHEKNQFVLEKVEEALKKVESGRYGRCENCGGEIPEDRLDAIPYTEFCIHCKKESEDPVRDDSRPIEEAGLTPPFARTYMEGKSDYTGYDGEDTWQDVGKYNWLPHVYYEDTEDESEERIGLVEDTDRISNEEYEDQLPD